MNYGLRVLGDSTINKLFDEVFGKTDFEDRLDGAYELENEFKIELPLPGLKKENFNVNTSNGVLTIETVEQESTRKSKYFKQISKQYNLGSAVETDRILATYEDGILVVKIPKKEQAKPKQITVQ